MKATGIVILLVLFVVAAGGCIGALPDSTPISTPSSTPQPAVTQSPAPTSTSTPPPTSTPAQTSAHTTHTPMKSPPIAIALDYVGIRNTHWIDQLGGPEKAEVQLLVIITDDTGTLASWPPDPQSLTFPMDFFQVISLKNYMGGTTVLYTGSVTGTLSIRVVANNVNKGAITKAQIDIIKALGGGDFTALKELIPDKELIGTYWQTWLPTNNWGTGSQFTSSDSQGSADLKIWGRIGGLNQMPPEISKPVITLNVVVLGKLPTNAKVRTTYYYNESDFSFILKNNESFSFPIYWHIETDSNPGTQVNFLTYATEGQINVPAKGTSTQTAKYWFNAPGDYSWKYVAEYPRGAPIASWAGTLHVSPFPDVKIQSVTLPSDAKVSSGFLVTNYKTVFRLINNESVDITVNWKANSSVTGNFDSGSVTVPKNGYVDVTKAYYYTKAGPVTITYTIYYNGVQIDTKSSTMNVAP